MSNYFTSYENYFWDWEYDDTTSSKSYAIFIPEIGTLIYAQRLLQLLEPLSTKGLPQLGSVILILIAASENLEENDYGIVKSKLASSLQKEGFGPHHVNNVMDIMDHVHNLPKDLRTGDNLIYLLEILFEKTHNRIGISVSKQAIEDQYVLENAVEREYYVETPNHSTYDKDTRPIALMVRRFKSMQDIIDALTNVPIIKEDPEEELLSQLNPVYNTETSLVDQLIEHKETTEIGSLIKRIWSGLHIPMHQNAASEQPLGGVSDITNKGDMSRLLISEFAYDQDTFLSRVANKEALYIERETANEENNNKRVFLIDGSLKNWGIPKILSFATALAIATHPKSTFEYAAYIIGDRVHQVNFDDILEIISGQQILSAQLDPALGLHDFYENFYESSHEVFLLTTEETLKSNDLQYVIADHIEQLQHLITTSSTGHIDFYRFYNRTRKHLKQIHLPYEELWEQQKPKKKEVAVNFNNSIDEITEDDMLTPLLKSEAQYIPYKDQVYILQDGNLYSFTSSGTNKGLQFMNSNVITYQNSAYCISSNANNDLIFHEYNAFAKAYYITNLKTGKSTSHRKFSKNLEGNCELFEVNKKIIASNNHHYYFLTENKIEKAPITMNSGLLRTLAAKHQLIGSCTNRLNSKWNNYSVLKNIEEIITIDFHGSLILKLDKYYLNTYSNKLELIKDYYRHVSEDNVITLTPIVDLYLKRVNSVENLKLLQQILNISSSKAHSFVRDIPTIIKKNLDQKSAEKLKKQLESKQKMAH
jgi:hypothetical protein